MFIYLFIIYLFTHIQSTTCCCMINAVYFKATVNYGGGTKKIKKKIHLPTHANSYVYT